MCVSRALSTSWAGPGHPGGRLRVSGISQYTGGKPPRKSHPLDPLLQPCDTALRLPIPMPRSPPGRGRTARKPSAAGAFLHDHQPSGVRRERKVAGDSSGSSYPFKGRLAEGSFFSSRIPETGARQGDLLLHQVGSEPAGSPSSPPPQTRAQMHAHTHSPGSHHPEPLHGPRKSPPARAPKRSPPGAPGSARWGKRGPGTHTRSPHSHGHRDCGSGCARLLSADTGCCCCCWRPGSRWPPPRLPRCCALLAPGSRAPPAASARPRRPARFIPATWPPAWTRPLAAPGRGCRERPGPGQAIERSGQTISPVSW